MTINKVHFIIILLTIGTFIYESSAFQTSNKLESVRGYYSSPSIFLNRITSFCSSTKFSRRTTLNLSRENPSNLPEEYSDFEDQPIGSSSSNKRDDNIQYETTIDWDAEWSKVVKNEDQPAKRKKDIAKSEVELAAIKARKEIELKMKAAKVQAQSARASIYPGNMTGDWRVWIGILLVISVASALIGGSGAGYSNDSFLI